MMNRVLLLLLHVLAVSCVESGKLILIGSNITLSFDAIEANFAAAVKASGEMGALYVAEPLNACRDLTNRAEDEALNGTSPFVLIIRGGCSFDDKVRKAQRAGFKAAIVYDNENSGVLIPMAGNAGGVKIPAVFVTKASGETMKRYVGMEDVRVWITPSAENSAWSIMAISFISLLAMSAVLATCFFVRRHRVVRRRSGRVREFHGMSRRLVKAMPTLIFTSVHEDNTTAFSCAICLDDYSLGDKIRVLPCRHKFHATCVDSWLTSWRTFCPVCKRDARTSTGDPPASETTPLLLSPSPSSSSILSSLASSSFLLPPQPPGSLPSSLSSSSFIRHSFRRSPPITVSRSSVDLRRQEASPAPSPSPSQRSSYASRMASPHSLGYPIRHDMMQRDASSSQRYHHHHHHHHRNHHHHNHHTLGYSESAGTFSPFTSTHSLPDY